MLVGQLPKVLGFSVSPGSFLAETGDLLQGIGSGQIHAMACVIGLSCLAVILGFRRWAPMVPGVLIAVAGATIFVSWFPAPIREGIAVIGSAAAGIAAIPDSRRVACGDRRAVCRRRCDRSGVLHRHERGFARVCAPHRRKWTAIRKSSRWARPMWRPAFFGLSRQQQHVAHAGGRSCGRQDASHGVGWSALCCSPAAFAPGLLFHLPQAALGAVVVAACLSLIEIRSVLRLYRLRRDEFVLSLACFLGVVLLGVMPGIFIAVSLSLLAFIWRAWQPYSAVMGYVEALGSYHDISRHPEAKCIDGLVLFRWDAPLFFANAELFRRRVLRAVSHAPTPVAGLLWRLSRSRMWT